MKFIKSSAVLALTFILVISTFINVNALRESKPGEKTIKNLLTTAMQPVGSTMYTWGGGWNAEDTGSGKGSTCIGVSPEWKDFYRRQNSLYQHSEEKSMTTGGFEHIDYGLDCAGFIGWVLYNTHNREVGKEGYVMPGQDMASEYSKKGWGNFAPRGNVIDYKPGDIMSINTDDAQHVWIVIGRCSDGSVVFVHSSPCGVQINGTVTPNDSQDSEAIRLASSYMSKYYPEWYGKYPKCDRGLLYLRDSEQMRWDVTGNSAFGMTDPDGYMQMSPEEILKNLFE